MAAPALVTKPAKRSHLPDVSQIAESACGPDPRHVLMGRATGVGVAEFTEEVPVGSAAELFGSQLTAVKEDDHGVPCALQHGANSMACGAGVAQRVPLAAVMVDVVAA
jgi:hypothetical protein